MPSKYSTTRFASLIPMIAQANQELDENGNFVKKQALARVGEEEACQKYIIKGVMAGAVKG